MLTGAMRTASDVGYEGYANLLAAVRVAAADQVRGLGTLVVFNDEIHAARYVTKLRKDVSNSEIYILLKINGRISDAVNGMRL